MFKNKILESSSSLNIFLRKCQWPWNFLQIMISVKYKMFNYPTLRRPNVQGAFMPNVPDLAQRPRKGQITPKTWTPFFGVLKIVTSVRNFWTFKSCLKLIYFICKWVTTFFRYLLSLLSIKHSHYFTTDFVFNLNNWTHYLKTTLDIKNVFYSR